MDKIDIVDIGMKCRYSRYNRYRYNNTDIDIKYRYNRYNRYRYKIYT